MKSTFTFFALMGFLAINAQTPSTKDTLIQVKLENLSTPTNAAFAIMGTTPTEIVKPSTVSEFTLSIQNASNDYSSFPNNYGLAVNPYWWINGKKLTFLEEFDTLNKVRLWRHLQVSAGVVSNVDESTNWRYGAGLKTNILAGRIDAGARNKYEAAMKFVNTELAEAFSQRVGNDAALQGLYGQRNALAAKKEAIDEIFPSRNSMDSLRAVEYKLLKAEIVAIQKQIGARQSELNKTSGDLRLGEASRKKLEEAFQAMNIRYGWKWDVGLASAWDLQSNKLDSSSLYRLGGWSNFGYSLPPGKNYQLSILGAGRFYYYDQVVYELENSTVTINDLGVIDGGLRLVLDADKISLSFEGLYRYGLSNAFESTYKLNAMLNYRFAENRMVYFSLGNDFNDNSVGDPSQIKVFVGVNLGFGDKTDVEYQLR